jgi:hypothetical protein
MALAGWRRGLRVRKKKAVIQNSITERILQEIRSNLSQRESVSVEMAPYLAKWAKIQFKHGLDPEGIADSLNDIGIPTLSGRGAWRGDTVKYLLSFTSPPALTTFG